MLTRATCSSSFLRDLTPTRRILSLLFVSATDRTDDRITGVGAAISDPYLSFATPLKSKKSTQSLRDFLPAIAAENDVGGILLITKPIISSKSSYVSLATQKITDQMMRLDLRSGSSSVRNMKFIESDVYKSLEEVLHEHQENPLWESVSITDLVCEDGKLRCMGTEEGVASLQATVGLQVFLDEHCGGWKNTFG